MILSRTAIKKAMAAGYLEVSPLVDADIEAAHINLHLGGETVVVKGKSFLIAKTLEHIKLSDKLCGFMEGKASLAKLGISVEQSSTFIEPGSDNQMTLEIFNASDKPVKLMAGQPIAKMFLLKVVDDI